MLLGTVAGHSHDKAGNPREHWLTELVLPDVGSLGSAVGLDQVIAVVVILLTGCQTGKLSFNPITFINHDDATLIRQDPFAAFDRDGILAVVMNGDVISERVRTRGGALEIRTVFQAIHGHFQSCEFRNRGCHKGLFRGARPAKATIDS